MEAVPRNLTDGNRRTSGLVCPECYGVLQVEALGPNDHLLFICRIGHTFSLTELLASKETDLEERGWSAVLAAEEMVALLGDLLRDGRFQADEVSETLAASLRTALRNDRALQLPSDRRDGSSAGDAPDSDA
jgi:hypothetical protein